VKIYTRSGDRGKTGLIGGQRVSKDHIRLQAYGSVDELNAQLGLAMAQADFSTELEEIWRTIQKKLFTLGSILAAPPEKRKLIAEQQIDAADVSYLEEKIDALDNRLPALSSFILPGGSVAAATTHVARTVCRRLERILVALFSEIEEDEILLQYVNRLSDFLFVAARYLNLQQGKKETSWP
jgi:cob(I)alamin adenosyltransferase